MSDPTQSGQQTPGWYPDPQSGQLRWWDGQQWGQFQQQAAAVPQAPMAGAGTVQNPQQMAMIAHLLGALLGFLGPLIIYLTSGKQDPFVEDQSVEALNFQLTILIGWVISYVLAFTVILLIADLLIWPILWLGQIVFGIIGAMAANRGEWYRYPFSIKFVKPTMGGAPIQ